MMLNKNINMFNKNIVDRGDQLQPTLREAYAF